MYSSYSPIWTYAYEDTYDTEYVSMCPVERSELNVASSVFQYTHQKLRAKRIECAQMS